MYIRRTNHGAAELTLVQPGRSTYRGRVYMQHHFVHTSRKRHVVVSAAETRVSKTLANVVALLPTPPRCG